MLLSPGNIDENGLDYAKVIGQDEAGVYVLMSNLSLETSRDHFGLKSRKYEMSYYSYNLQEKWHKVPEANPTTSYVENISFFNNQLIVISSEELKGGEVRLYITVYNDKGEITIKGKQIYTGTISKNSDLAKPRILVSPDKTKLGLALEDQKNDGITIHFCALNDQFEVVRQGKETISYSTKDATLSDYVITNKADFLFLGYTKEMQADGDKSKLRIFNLFFMPNGEAGVKTFPFNNMDQQMTEAALVLDKNNNKAIVTGFFADKSSFPGASLLYGTLNLQQPEKFIVHTGLLNNDAQLKLVGQRNAGGGISLFNYPIQRVIPRSDGGALVIAEAAYLSEYSFYDYFTQTFNRRVEFHFDNILALSVNADGTVHWSQLIRKEQTSLDDEGLYSSFNIVLSPEELFIIYNNDIGRKNEIIGEAINAQGKTTTRTFSKSSDSISILPRAGKQVDEDTFIVPAVTKKKLFLVKIVI